MKKSKLTRNYQDHLINRLSNPNLAAEYLNTVINDIKRHNKSQPEQLQALLLLAIKNVAQAHGGMSNLAETAGISRQSLHQILSENGNPTLSSLIAILDACGIEFSFQAQRDKAV
jgi:probable addiction module antidote protein